MRIKMTNRDEEKPFTKPIPEAGKKYFGLSRNGSYEAAKLGIIPTIDVGRNRKKALVRPLEQKLNGNG
jgi:hypothetical protein